MKNYTEADYKTAHKFCIRNSEKLKNDKACGCFYCLSVFSPKDIKNWLKEKRPIKDSNSDSLSAKTIKYEYDEEMTALCPFCQIDSVIGESCGYPVTREFLEKMNEFWFDGQKKLIKN